MPVAFENNSSVKRKSLAEVSSNGKYVRTWVLVSLRNFVAFLSNFYSVGEVGLFPGAISWIGAYMSGLIFTPTYWDKAC